MDIQDNYGIILAAIFERKLDIFETCWSELTNDEIKIIDLYVGLTGSPKSYTEIAAITGTSFSVASQRVYKALLKLKYEFIKEMGYYNEADMINIADQYETKISLLEKENMQLKEQYNFLMKRIKYFQEIEFDLDIMSAKISEIEFSIRVKNCLKKAGNRFIFDLVQNTEQNLLQIKGFGRYSLNEVKHWLSKNNLSLGIQFPEYALKAMNLYLEVKYIKTEEEFLNALIKGEI